MELDELAQHWNAMGRDDPLWAVLTFPDKRHGRWDVDEFLATGEQEVRTYLRFLDSNGVSPPRGRALDFGCGPGRITQALCKHFERVDGVDIAPSMIELARQWNQHGDRCQYHVNDRADLSVFGDGTLDFAFSFQVLQHIEPRFQLSYISELARCLAPGGVAFFQVVTAEKEGATEPLPGDAFRADIEIAAPMPPLFAGVPAGVAVKVTNRSDSTWPMMGRDGWYLVTIGNHWVGDDGEVLASDDGRAYLPTNIAPGQSAAVVLSITPPASPGRYQLEVDLVQEGVTWFSAKGMTPAQLVVDVTEARERAHDETSFKARMEMHVVSREACSKALAASGCSVVGMHPLVDIIGGVEHDYERTFVIARR